MSGPAIGEPDPDRAEPSRTGSWDAAGGILVLLALGLTFRLIIAYLLPGSGFGADLSSFRFWADNLANQGIFGFYDRAADPQTGSSRTTRRATCTSCGSSGAWATSSGAAPAT